MRAADLIELFERMYREHWKYEWGAARRGCVDCSGAFVYAYRQLGASIYHGSNAIARRYVGKLTKEARPGYAAFKWRSKDTAKYPDGRGDFYHIGLVDASGQYVLNAQGTKAGFTRTNISKWHWFAPLNAVEYNLSAAAAASPLIGETGDERSGSVIYQAVVTTKSGNLNVRREAGITSTKIGSLPKGETVDVLDEKDGWAYIGGEGLMGWVSMEFLTKTEPTASGGDDVPSPNPPQQAGAGEDDGMAFGVFVPCQSRGEAEALAKAHVGAILTAFKPPDD